MEENKEPFDPYKESYPPSREIKPVVPDFVTKTKAYLKDHPEVIREVAGDEIQKLEAYLDTFPMGTGEIFKAKLNEFLGAPGTTPGVQQGTVNAPGRETIPLDRQGQEEQPEIDLAEDLSIPEQKEIIEFIADLSEQGFDNMEIIKAIRREYGIEYHPLTIKRMLKAYYAKPDDDVDDGDKEPVSKSLRVYQKLLERNAELQKKIEELSKAPVILQTTPQIPIVPARRGGVFGRLLRYLFWD